MSTSIHQTTNTTSRAAHISLPARSALAVAACGAFAIVASAQPAASLARHFGFDPPRMIVVDDNAGPFITADFNADGLTDIAIINNRKSRVELHLQRSRERTEVEIERTYKINELPPSPWYDKIEISVAHRVLAIAAHDVDEDGAPDLIYAGDPGELVIMKQVSTDTFEIMSRRRARGLGATRSAFSIANVKGDSRPELLTVVGGRIHIFDLSRAGAIGEPTQLGSGESNEQIVAFFTDDFDGDGRTDILGAIPDNDAPLRLWLQIESSNVAGGVIGPELRFESPALREVEPIHFQDRLAASVAVIERATKRIVFYDFKFEDQPRAAVTGEREAQAKVYSLTGGAGATVIADINADSMPDILAADQAGNRVELRLQSSAVGLGHSQLFSALSSPKALAAGQWDSDPELEVFVLSEEEKTVGVSQFDPQSNRLDFPQPVQIATGGAEPVALAHASLEDGPALAIVVKKRRDLILELHRPGNSPPDIIELEDVKRAPESILPTDIDGDGAVDLLLFTAGEPMVVILRSSDDDAEVLTDETMPQFGLVQAASASNTALLDIDGDNRPELLLADKNFVRATAFDRERGWRVIEQVTVQDASTSFAAMTVRPATNANPAVVYAADSANKRIVVMTPEFGAWSVKERLTLPGYNIKGLRAGAFAGDRVPGLLALGDGSFGVIRLQGQRAHLAPFAAHRTNQESRFEHELTSGDLNGDGHTDVVALDASEQMAEIFTFSDRRRFYEGPEFKVFETRLFMRGDSREYEPSDARITDVTGDGASDLVLMAHDRVIIYPQMTTPR